MNWLDQMSVVWITALSSLQCMHVGKQCKLKVMEGEEQPDHLEGLKGRSQTCNLCISEPGSPSISSLPGL